MAFRLGRRFVCVAFHPVRAFRVITNRGEPRAPNQVFGQVIVVAFGDLPFEPFRQPFRLGFVHLVLIIPGFIPKPTYCSLTGLLVCLKTGILKRLVYCPLHKSLAVLTIGKHGIRGPGSM